MKTDRELLELAARAAGYGFRISQEWHNKGTIEIYIKDSAPADHLCWHTWNPLTDDGDALRLAVLCKLDILPVGAFTANENKICALVQDGYDKINEVVPHDDNPMQAVRRAIVRAAAAIGEGMK